MPPTYVPITLEQMQEVLKPEKGWITRTHANSEICFEFEVKNYNPLILIKVYSSIHPNTDCVREVGADAIRVCLLLWDGSKFVGLKSFNRCNRTKGWSVTLRNRVMEAFHYAKNKVVFCKRCGKIMCERENTNTKIKFMGCSNYPECSYTEPIITY